MAAGARVVFAAPGLNLAEVVFGDEFSDGPPEIVTRRTAAGPGIGHEAGDARFEGIPAALLGFTRQVGRPGQHAPGLAFKEKAHERRLIGDRCNEPLAEIVAQALRIGRVGQLDEFAGGLGQEEIRIGQRIGKVAVGVGTRVQEILRDGHDFPGALGCGPRQAPVADSASEVDGLLQVDDAIALGKGRGEHKFARRHSQFDGARLRGRVGDIQSLGLPLGVVAQGQASRLAGGIAPLVVEPEGHAPGPGQVHTLNEGGPAFLALDVSIEGHVRHDTAETLGGEGIEELFLRFRSGRQVVHDLEDARVRRRNLKTFRERAFGRLAPGSREARPKQNPAQDDGLCARFAGVSHGITLVSPRIAFGQW